MTTSLDVSTMRRDFADAMNRVAYKGERIIIARRGKQVAAMVPIEDLGLLEAIEDRLDVHEALEALRDAKQKGTKPAAEFWEELGL